MDRYIQRLCWLEWEEQGNLSVYRSGVTRGSHELNGNGSDNLGQSQCYSFYDYETGLLWLINHHVTQVLYGTA